MPSARAARNATSMKTGPCGAREMTAYQAKKPAVIPAIETAMTAGQPAAAARAGGANRDVARTVAEFTLAVSVCFVRIACMRPLCCGQRQARYTIVGTH